MAASKPLITLFGIKSAMKPAFNNPIKTCKNPAINTAVKKILKSPNCWMAANTTAANPAAGPLTLVDDWLMKPTTIPPITPDMIPDNKGAPEAKATPKHNGRATRKTTREAGKSALTFSANDLEELILANIQLDFKVWNLKILITL